MFRVKICGVTTAVDALTAADAGADAVGLNFVPGSPRCLDVTQARAVAAVLPAGVLKVGVFAGMPAGDILRIAREVPLDAIQLHGHLDGDDDASDPPDRCRELLSMPLIRAVRLDAGPAGDDRLAGARTWIEAARALGHGPAMVIVDASVMPATEPGRLGGRGETVDWQAVAAARPLDLPMAIAGGLTPANVAEAIARSGLRAVDTASGVEASPGQKDPEKVRAFVSAALAALAALNPPPESNYQKARPQL
jgi:phosphoribosylanthranilate isomerase